MLFVNETEKDVRARVLEPSTGMRQKLYKWIKVKVGGEIDLPDYYGKNLGFTPKEIAKKAEEVEETIKGKSGKEEVETKVLKKKAKK